MPTSVAGFGPGERRLNGVQTTGREYRNLSDPAFGMRRTNDVEIAVRDGTVLMADLFRPDADGRFPALLSFSPYPRQIQDVGAPLGFIEAGASDFFVPRGYAHAIVNARGTGGSGGSWGLFDGQERDDLHDLVEWAAAQPWCDGNVGMLGVSYFAMAQLAAAVTKPPHLKAIAPPLATDDLYEAAWHHGLLNAGFISAWLPAIGVMSETPDAFWRGAWLDLARRVLRIPAIHARMQHLNGEAIVAVLKGVIRKHPPRHYDDLWRAVAVEHPKRDAFWDERNVRPLLGAVDIPVYLGADWENVPLHLPSTFAAWQVLRHNPNVRMALLPAGGFAWPWEALHVEVLAWYDHLPADSGVPGNAGPPELPSSLAWETPTLQAALAFAGNIELVLEATITALDTSWIAVVYDVPPEGAAGPVTAGWLRASLSTVDEAASTPGAPSLDCRTSVAVPVGQRVVYRLPLVPNARHLPAGHGLRLVIASAEADKYPTMIGFTHVPVREASRNAVFSASRLLLPLLRAGEAD